MRSHLLFFHLIYSSMLINNLFRQPNAKTVPLSGGLDCSISAQILGPSSFSRITRTIQLHECAVHSVPNTFHRLPSVLAGRRPASSRCEPSHYLDAGCPWLPSDLDGRWRIGMTTEFFFLFFYLNFGTCCLCDPGGGGSRSSGRSSRVNSESSRTSVYSSRSPSPTPASPLSRHPAGGDAPHATPQPPPHAEPVATVADSIVRPSTEAPPTYLTKTVNGSVVSPILLFFLRAR